MNVTTSIPLEIYNIAKEKHIKWSEALIFGIIQKARGKYIPEPHVTIVEETEKNTVEKLKNAIFEMQKHIDKLNEQIDKKNGDIQPKT